MKWMTPCPPTPPRASAGKLAVREASARSALELAATRARRGMSDEQPVLQAQRALLAIQRERAANDSELAMRLLAICKASGLAPQP